MKLSSIIQCVIPPLDPRMNRAIQDKHPRNRAKRFRALLQLQNTTVWKVLNENVVAILWSESRIHSLKI